MTIIDFMAKDEKVSLQLAEVMMAWGLSKSRPMLEAESTKENYNYFKKWFRESTK